MLPRITHANIDELPIIKELAYATWFTTYQTILKEEQILYMLQKMYSIDALTEQFINLHHVFLLVKENNTAVAFASYGFIQEKQSIKIHKLYVLPSHQGQGIGQGLLNHIKHLACSEQVHSLSLNVNRYNPALEFYKAMNFQITKEENINIGNNYWMEDYVMENHLLD